MSAAKPGRPLSVVLDTNVYFSAFTNRGVPYDVWHAALTRRYSLIDSPPMIAEIAGVLRAVAAWEEPRIVRRLKLLAKVAEFFQELSLISLRVITHGTLNFTQLERFSRHR